MAKAKASADNAPLLEMKATETGEAKASPVASVPAKVAPAEARSANALDIMALVVRVAENPSIDVEKFERFVALQERILDRQAKADFDAHFADMQVELPVIDRRGRIIVREKDARGQRTGQITQDTKFARFEDINEAVRPVLSRHGFSVRFETGMTDDNRIKVVGVLSGWGHRERSEFVLPHDSTGSKNNVQAIGSSTSYGKRYALCALLNITTRGEDDDGTKGGERAGPEPITAEQADKIVNRCGEVQCDKSRLLNYLNGSSRPNGHPEVKDISEIPASRFDEVMRGLNQIAKATNDGKAGDKQETSKSR